MGGGTANGPLERRTPRSTPPSVCSRACGSTSSTADANCVRCGSRSSAAVSFSWCIGFFAPTARARLSNRIFLRLSFPPRWHYDILRALDYFQAVNAPRDQRLAEAIGILQSKQSEGGRWPLENSYRGKAYFELEMLGAPSRWNTLRALRVLKWWEGDAKSDVS